MAHTASNPIRVYFVINFDLSARKRLQSVVLRYFMQASRVNGLTSGVFAFLVPASCLNQKGSDTRSDNTIFLSGYDDLHAPGFYCRNPGCQRQDYWPLLSYIIGADTGSGENLLFPASGVGQLSNAKASVLHLHGVLPRISSSHTTSHRRFFPEEWQYSGRHPAVFPCRILPEA